MHTSTGNLMLDPTPALWVSAAAPSRYGLRQPDARGSGRLKARAGVGAPGVKWTLPGRRQRFISLGTAGGFLSQQVGER